MPVTHEYKKLAQETCTSWLVQETWMSVIATCSNLQQDSGKWHTFYLMFLCKKLASNISSLVPCTSFLYKFLVRVSPSLRLSSCAIVWKLTSVSVDRTILFTRFHSSPSRIVSAYSQHARITLHHTEQFCCLSLLRVQKVATTASNVHHQRRNTTARHSFHSYDISRHMHATDASSMQLVVRILTQNIVVWHIIYKHLLESNAAMVIEDLTNALLCCKLFLMWITIYPTAGRIDTSRSIQCHVTLFVNKGSGDLKGVLGKESCHCLLLLVYAINKFVCKTRAGFLIGTLRGVHNLLYTGSI